ncbi:MAG: translation initiation factor IF-2 N-terminal domain-containing protein, partial [Actinobacteria bacterium]|nr:translation initiation factor IF-2 N-terminal domain-containing protein [Actinomycetota bacterium]
MSRRVYEIARELDLDTKEVIGRLNEAGVEVKHHSASVEDPVYERVFGDGADGQNGRSEAQEAEAREARAEAERSG